MAQGKESRSLNLLREPIQEGASGDKNLICAGINEENVRERRR